MYREHPGRFERPASRFARWALPRLRALGRHPRVVELGCGPGRDARYFAARGCVVRAVDHAPTAIARARAHRPRPSGVSFLLSEARRALERTRSGTADAVYAHAVYMMFSERELDRLLAEVRRVVRPGGLHLFAVRSSRDPRARRAREVVAGVWQGGPHPHPYRYFRARSLDTLTRVGFRRVARHYEPEAYLWFVCDRRP